MDRRIGSFQTNGGGIHEIVLNQGERFLIGSLVRVNDFCLYVAKSAGKHYSFIGSLIIDYRGESPEEIGLIKGANVGFIAIDSNIDYPYVREVYTPHQLPKIIFDFYSYNPKH